MPADSLQRSYACPEASPHPAVARARMCGVPTCNRVVRFTRHDAADMCHVHGVAVLEAGPRWRAEVRRLLLRQPAPAKPANQCRRCGQSLDAGLRIHCVECHTHLSRFFSVRDIPLKWTDCKERPAI